VPGRDGLRFAFYGRVSTEDRQDPVTSRARQQEQARVLVAGHGTIVAGFFDSGHSRTLHVLFWGHEPRPATGWNDPEHLAAWMYSTTTGHGLPADDVRPLVHQLTDAFWCHPSPAKARAWGTYPYDSDPAGTAIRPLARPFTPQDHTTRGDRAWLPGFLTLCTPQARAAYLHHAPPHESLGAPETD
jgi:hypothetical protein